MMRDATIRVDAGGAAEQEFACRTTSCTTRREQTRIRGHEAGLPGRQSNFFAYGGHARARAGSHAKPALMASHIPAERCAPVRSAVRHSPRQTLAGRYLPSGVGLTESSRRSRMYERLLERLAPHVLCIRASTLTLPPANA